MNEKLYFKTCKRIEELIKLVGNNTSIIDKNFIDLNELSDLVADYEEKKFVISK